MTKITQISAAAMLAAFASTAFVSTAEAGSKKVWCEQTSSYLFRTACEQTKRYRQYRTPTQRPRPVGTLNNFRSRTATELGLRDLNGGGNGGGRK